MIDIVGVIVRPHIIRRGSQVDAFIDIVNLEASVVIARFVHKGIAAWALRINGSHRQRFHQSAIAAQYDV